MSEILPHEVPPRFSLRTIYERIRDKTEHELDKAICPGPPNKPLETIPYVYKLVRDRKKPRQIHVMHPFHYRTVAKFLETFSTQVIVNCRKSRWSLRAPYAIAKRFRINTPLRAGSDSEQDQAVNPTRYFAYRPFRLLYSFYDSEDFGSLESRFRFQRMLDVQACFDNIYTHAISWAIRGKSHAKRQDSRNAWHTLDAQFDSLMRSMNHGETHGILVGPELSRVFAELLLQTVDSAAEARLLETFVHGTHYEVRRYVDDIFIFFNDEVVADQVEATIREELRLVKLLINESKTTQIESPFMSDSSALKHKISDSMDRYESKIRSYKERNVHPPSGIGLRMLKEFKRIVSESNCTYESCVSYALTILQKKFERSGANLSQLYVESGIVFFASRLLELDFRYQTAVRYSLFYEIGREKLSRVDDGMSRVQRLDEEMVNQITKISANAISRELVPVLPLLVVLIPLASLDLLHEVHSDLVRLIWLSATKSMRDDEIDYFTVLGLLFVAANRVQHSAIRTAIMSKIKVFFDHMPDNCKRADALMLASDLACCPFLSVEERKSMIDIVSRFSGTKLNRNQVFNAVSGSSMFFDWDSSTSTLTYLLEKQTPIGYA
ncbi:antiviral reverse transcriptase Drt3b [Rosistilla ulvae]|uniref:antiviral reverse transcriptase Drt3b n=1 Tax=Rosistilla ulvae TaxID=1930277 RepID=UPI0011A3558B|nr:antiviral reverse transcriptase Drt3b [Rosistilla ulvae]